jgi:flagellar motor switch protein FliN/FliY
LKVPDTETPERTLGFVSHILRSVPIELRVVVGRARLTVGELAELELDAVVPLDQRIDQAVELVVGDRVVATGELIEQDGAQAGHLAVRITHVIDAVDAT